ncbi:MFS transporter [Nonomuraea glycinis]|uniref:MFS transporter n=1 Tax=Nonomuraea glycinis TaxID=2047744 RepID=UPI002E13424F|nr:MFS transporter [Nonomuraea glycinis]
MIGRLLVCAAGAFLSVGLLIPAVPRYVTGPLGQQAGMVGVSLAVTAVAGVLARPLAGRVADRAGRRTALRGVAGIGEALAYVGLATLASDHRRLGLTLPKTMSADTESASPDPGTRRARLYHTSALRPGFGYLASVWGYTAISAFLPLHLAALGGSGGLHFLAYGGVLVAIRLAGYRLLATAAPTRLAVTSLLLTGTGSILLAAWPSPAGTWCAIALIGAGQGLGLPAFLRMAVHGLPARERGSAVATTTAFFDIGFLTAALALGALADRFGLAGGFALAGVVSAAGALLFLPVRHHEHEGAPLDRSPR